MITFCLLLTQFILRNRIYCFASVKLTRIFNFCQLQLFSKSTQLIVLFSSQNNAMSPKKKMRRRHGQQFLTTESWSNYAHVKVEFTKIIDEHFLLPLNHSFVFPYNEYSLLKLAFIFFFCASLLYIITDYISMRFSLERWALTLLFLWLLTLFLLIVLFITSFILYKQIYWADWGQVSVRRKKHQQIYQTIVCLLDLYQSTEKACTGLAFSPGGRNIFFYKDVLSWQKEEETRALSPKLKQVLARFDRYEQRRSVMPSFVLQRLHSVECTDFSEALYLKNEFITEKGALTNCTINKIHRVGRALNRTTFLQRQKLHKLQHYVTIKDYQYEKRYVENYTSTLRQFRIYLQQSSAALGLKDATIRGHGASRGSRGSGWSIFWLFFPLVGTSFILEYAERCLRREFLNIYPRLTIATITLWRGVWLLLWLGVFFLIAFMLFDLDPSALSAVRYDPNFILYKDVNSNYVRRHSERLWSFTSKASLESLELLSRKVSVPAAFYYQSKWPGISYYFSNWTGQPHTRFFWTWHWRFKVPEYSRRTLIQESPSFYWQVVLATNEEIPNKKIS